jgi:hypothetical protein
LACLKERRLLSRYPTILSQRFQCSALLGA